MHQEGGAGPTSTPTPPSPPPRPQSSSPGNSAGVLPKASPPGGVPNPPPLAREFSLLVDGHGRPRKTKGAAARGRGGNRAIRLLPPPSVSQIGARRPQSACAGSTGSPFLGTLGSGCPGNPGRGACFSALGGKGGGGKRHTGTRMGAEGARARTRTPARTHPRCMQAPDPSVAVLLRALPALAAEPPVVIQVCGTLPPLPTV